MRKDIPEEFSAFYTSDAVIDYLYYINAQDLTGESAFWQLYEGFAWAKKPLCVRFQLLDPGNHV